jgi:hypothetical protein
MHHKTAFPLVVVSWVLACFPANPTVAQSTERIGGSWFASEGTIGLVLQKGDSHPYFLFGRCNKLRRHVDLNLEIEPKLFGDAIAREDYIIMRWGDQRSKVDSFVEGISLNEAGRYVWSLSLTANPKLVNFWLEASRLELTVGVRQRDMFKARQNYVLPDEDRQAAISSFIRSCFSDEPPVLR